jgi:hypothetical protein
MHTLTSYQENKKIKKITIKMNTCYGVKQRNFKVNISIRFSLMSGQKDIVSKSNLNSELEELA